MTSTGGQVGFRENSRQLMPQAVTWQIIIMSFVSVSSIATRISICLNPPHLVFYHRSVQFYTPKKQGTNDSLQYKFRTKVADLPLYSTHLPLFFSLSLPRSFMSPKSNIMKATKLHPEYRIHFLAGFHLYYLPKSLSSSTKLVSML